MAPDLAEFNSYRGNHDMLTDILLFWEFPDELKAQRESWDAMARQSAEQRYFASELKTMAQHTPLRNLELTLDFRSLENFIIQTDLRNRGLASFLDMCRVVTDTVAAVMSPKGEKFAKFFVYLPEAMDENDANDLEKRVMGEDYDSFGSGKFTCWNRYEYWVSYLQQTRGYLDHL